MDVGIAVGGTVVGVAFGGTGVGVAVGGEGVGEGWDVPHETKNSKTNVKPVICGNNLL
jgi:hypothetical protein